MRLNREQIESLSKYFSDASKILLGSTVVAFFVPTEKFIIATPTFIIGSMATLLCLLISIALLESRDF